MAAAAVKKRKISDGTQLYEQLTCPCCLMVPWTAKIFSCKNGHTVCGKCQPLLESCPVCRESPVDTRSRFAECFLEQEKHLVEIGCQFDECRVKGSPDGILRHELDCTKRLVKCPGFHRAACDWTGPFNKLAQHNAEKLCIRIIRLDQTTGSCTATITNFRLTGESVLGCKQDTHWKPILLFSAEHLHLFAYFLVYRTGKGEWILSVRSLASKHYRIGRLITLEILPVVEQDTEKQEVSQQGWTFSGPLTSSDQTEEEFRTSGNYLTLQDAHISQLSNGYNLFKYRIKISAPQSGSTSLDSKPSLSEEPIYT